MKANLRLLLSVFILSVYLISCYPKKEIFGRYPNGKLQVVRHHKRGYKWNERYVYYYDNGKKQFVRYWRNDLMQVYKMKEWYRSGAKQSISWMKEKDTVRKYNASDSEFVFMGLSKDNSKGWYENGKLKFETIITKDHFSIENYYDSSGVRTMQRFIKQLRPDDYDTIAFRTEIEPSGKTYTQRISWEEARLFTK
jgi:antitoxin component YwqK of YwqJK toxin-antitoxin module